jgi:inhibitor of KinA sporulation pathway (predicted exonuclease)
MKAIVVDTEYTTWPGALESNWSLPGQQREIVQIAAVRVDQSFREEASFERIVRPTLNPELSPLFVELTGLTQERVDAEGVPFARALDDFAAFCGDLPIVCMNADCAVFITNCDVNGVHYPFGRQFHRLRPQLARTGVDLTTHSSGDLHLLTGSPLRGHTHNALHDVRSMAAWMAFARANGTFGSIEALPTDLPMRDPRGCVLPDDELDAMVRTLAAAGRQRGWFERAPDDLPRIVQALMMSRQED